MTKLAKPARKVICQRVRMVVAARCQPNARRPHFPAALHGRSQQRAAEPFPDKLGQQAKALDPYAAFGLLCEFVITSRRAADVADMCFQFGPVDVFALFVTAPQFTAAPAMMLANRLMQEPVVFGTGNFDPVDFEPLVGRCGAKLIRASHFQPAGRFLICCAHRSRPMKTMK